MFYKKNYIESSLHGIWIRIRFLEINGSPSLFYFTYCYYPLALGYYSKSELGSGTFWIHSAMET